MLLWQAQRLEAERQSFLFGKPLAEPYRKLLLAYIATGGFSDDDERIRWIENKLIAVFIKEQVRDNPGRSLVRVYKCVVAGDAESIGGGKVRNIGFAIGGDVLRPCERAFE